MYVHTTVYIFGGNKLAQKRTSIVIDTETKEVFDWSMGEEGTRNTSEHTRRLLEKCHKEEWPKLLKRTRVAKLVCEKHEKPFTLICKDCGLALCPKCRIDLHKDHDLQFFCRIHEVGYQTTCLLCERDRWEGIVDVNMIDTDDLKEELASGNIICVDVRGDSDWNNGHLPKSHHIKWVDFRLKNTEGHKELMQLVKMHEDKRWVFMSQGSSKNPGRPARAWLAAADVKTMYNIEDVACLKGGWLHFHEKFLDIVEYSETKEIPNSRRS